MRIKISIAAALAMVGAVMLAASAFAGSIGSTAASSSAVAKKGGTLRVAVADDRLRVRRSGPVVRHARVVDALQHAGCSC